MLLDAYRHGIFPWPTAEGPWAEHIWWWSPDPRAIIEPDGFHISRSLGRTLRSQRFATSRDTAFSEVVAACADREGEPTWITPAITAAYCELHRAGHAHSVEVWDARGDLVGGVYGVAVGAAFCGESMFHRATDASKVALATLVEHLRRRGFAFLDAQMQTPHLVSLGAVEWPRARYLAVLRAAVREDVRW